MIKAIIFDFNRTIYDPDQGRLFEGVESMILNLSKDHKLALLTTGDRLRERIIKDLGIGSYFWEILIVEEKKLPHLSYIAKKFDLNSNEILVVGDRFGSEIKLANRLNMKTVWLATGRFAPDSPKYNERGPDKTIQSITDLEKTIRELNAEA